MTPPVRLSDRLHGHLEAKKNNSGNMVTTKREYPKVIPPLSVVELARADAKTPAWKEELGRRFRVGYYSKQDGLDVIWLVDETGDYCETTDRDFLLKYFDIIELSEVSDYFGDDSEIIGPLRE